MFPVTFASGRALSRLVLFCLCVEPGAVPNGSKGSTGAQRISLLPARAQFELAGMLFEGRGVAQNEREAAALYRAAARRGHVGAQCALGLCCMYGRGCKLDPKEGLQWLDAAAQQGHGPAKEELASMHAAGAGVPKDAAKAARLEEEAKAWYREQLFAFYLAEAGPRGGVVAASAHDLSPHLDHVRDQLEVLRRSMAAAAVASPPPLSY